MRNHHPTASGSRMGASVPYSSIHDDIRGNCGRYGGKAVVREGGFEPPKAYAATGDT
jgi:hypothetical protein